MFNIREHLFNKLIFEEAGGPFMNEAIGLSLVTPITKTLRSAGLKDYGIELPESLKEVYRQIEYIMVAWGISPEPTEEKPNEIPEVLKQDPWLKENYWNEGYGSGIIHEYLSGFINIQKLEDMLNPEYCKDQNFYFTIDLNIKELNPDDYVPFDIHWSLTACLKKENGKILDNVWIVHTDAQKIHDMKITIEKYMELCYKAKAFHYWQLVYILRENTFYYELMKRYLPMLFPHLELDLSDFGIDTGKS